MDERFWQERWATRQIGFHEGKPNDLLAQHIALLDGRKRVLVPLAGKAVDMMLLASRGMSVVGVELVEAPCREFFDDNALPHRREGDRFVSEDGRITIVCGDMLACTRESLGTFDAVYDRAALVALDPSMRRAYVDTIARMLEPAARTLLVTFAYDQSKIDGPPWSVSDADVHALYGRDARSRIELVTQRALVPRPKFIERGVTSETESLYVIDNAERREHRDHLR
jgi:thiopurine S-methyltransferase